MIIALTDTINYDTDICFSGQTSDCVSFVNDYIITNESIVNWDDTNRPYQYVYSNTNWNIIKTEIWNTDPPSCGISEEIITVEGNELWHESDCKIQIIMSFENNILMLQQYPEFAVYVKTNNIKSYIVENYVYLYVNYILDEHRYLLTMFGAIINEKN